MVIGSVVLLAMALEPGTVSVPRASSAPAIDCRLDDEVWSQAARISEFHQTRPGDNARPSRATEVLLAYTPDALYVGLRAEDEPGRVRARLAKRDALDDDDSIALYLDTFHDRRRAYVVMVNPLGVQQDGVYVEGNEPDYSVDLLLRSQGCLDERGYTVELAIPFESLRYEAGSGRAWGLHVLRQIKHLDEEDSWMPLRRDRIGVERTGTRELRARLLAQAGSLTGLEGLRHAPLVEWIPVANAVHAEGRSADLGLSGTARAALTPAMTVDVALNPDFAEVEADQPQSTANQRFPLFYDEKRPFFLEGAELFRTPVRAFHSRSLVDPEAAVKATGTRGRTSATALLALDAAPGRFTEAERADPAVAPLAGEKALGGVLRVRREVGAQSSLGLLATAWRFADRHNQVLSFDGRVALGERTVWTFQALGTRARLPFADPGTGGTRLRTGQGFGYSSEWARSGKRLSLQLAGEGYSPDYRATLGYTQRVDTNRWSLLTRYNSPPRARGALVSWSALNTTLAQFDWRGRMQYAYTYPRLHLAFRRQSFLRLSAYQDYARVFEEEFGPARSATRAGAFAGPSAERSSLYHGLTVEVGGAPTERLALGLSFDRSWHNLDYDQGAGRFARVSPGALVDPQAPLDPGPASYRWWGATLTLQPSDALRLTGSYEHGRLTREDTGLDAFDQHLSSLRLQYAFSRFTSLRTRLDYDSLDKGLFQQAVFAWTPRPGSALYLGYDETGEWATAPRAERSAHSRYARRSRTLFAKLSWALRSRLGRAPREEPAPPRVTELPPS